MKPALTSLLVALFTCTGGLGLSESPANAADVQFQSNNYNWTPQSFNYVIQVEYKRRLHYGVYTYKWVTVYETTSRSGAEFVYGLYEYAEDEGILDEIAPDIGSRWSPTRVRMVTIYRNFEPVLSPSLK